jgi:hypothetical protein
VRDDETAEPKEEEVHIPETPLRWLADSYEQIQRLRIRIGNQISAVERLTDAAPVPNAVRSLYLKLREAERDVVRDMEGSLKLHPAFPWLDQVYGLGPTLGAKILGLIGHIEKFPNRAKLPRFAGYGLHSETGERDRLVKGQKSVYCLRLKTALYLWAGSVLKANGKYRIVYDRGRARYAESRPDWTKGHQHAAAMRLMVKMFLSHLWEVWRRVEGLEVEMPYAIAVLGHSTYIPPDTFLGKLDREVKEAA